MYAMKKPILQKDVIIIGAGMAGLTAALYASRLQLSVLVLENGIVGGQIANATNIENYPGIFVNIGIVPNTELFAQELPLAEGRIRAGEDCRTDIPGVFAAGDVREKEIRQLTTAAADGTTAALLAGKYIEQIKRANSR